MKKVLISIGAALLGMLLLNVVFLLTTYIFAFIINLIDSIPILNLIAKLLFPFSRDLQIFSPYIIIAAVITEMTTTGVVNRISETDLQQKVSYIIMGTFTCLAHGILAMINLGAGNGLSLSVPLLIIGIIYTWRGMKIDA